MRKSTDYCLLCKSNQSTKTNSHILPKFLTKKLFGDKTQKRGFQVSSKYPITKPPQVIQDSPKENHILCPDCEDYFSVLETYSHDTLIKWKDKIKSEDFGIISFQDVFSIVEYVSSDKLILRLFIYSIFWRASISGHKMFEGFKISSNIEEDLRLSLLTFKSANKTGLDNLLSNENLDKIFPFAVITSESFTDETSNMIFPSPREDFYRLLVDQFDFILFIKEEDISEIIFRIGSNIKVSDGKILIFKEHSWREFIVQPVIDILTEKIKEND